MSRLLWSLYLYFLLQIQTIQSACTVYGKEYDAEEYAFLCKNNITIPEKIMQEILAVNPSSAWNSKYFSDLAQQILDDLMTTFREDVADIYLKNTCDNHFCHPHLLTEQKPKVPENIPRYLEVHSIELIQQQILQEEINDIAIMPAPNDGIYLTVAYYRKTHVTLFHYGQNKLNLVREFTSHSGNCLATTSSSWTPPMTIVTTCKLKSRHDELFYQKTNTTPIYIFTATKTEMEMTQAIEIKNSLVTATQVYFEKGIPALMTLTQDGFGHQYAWNDYEFDLLKTSISPAAAHIKSFKIGLGTYLAYSNFLSLTGFESKGAHIYQSLRHKAGQFHLFQRLGNCIASSTEHFTISDLHFVAMTCYDENLVYIYWWTGNQFLLWQTIPSVKAASLTAVRLINWEVLLVLVEYPDDVPVIRFLQYEDDYFWPIDKEIILRKHAPNRQIKIASFHYKGDTMLILNGQRIDEHVSEPLPLVPEVNSLPDFVEYIPLPTFRLRHDYSLLNSLWVYKIKLKPRITTQTVNAEQDEIIQCLTNLENILEKERNRLSMLDVPAWDTMVTDRQQTVTGEKILLEGLYATEVHVENLILHPTVIVEPQNNFVCDECERKEEEINAKLSKLYIEAEDLVLRTRPEVVTGKKIVMNNIFVSEMFQSHDIFTGPVCNINISDLHATVLYKTGNQIFNVTTMHSHITTTNIDIIGLVNRVNLHNVATLHGSRHFTAPQTFSSVNVENIEITGTLNDMNPRDIVVNNLPQKIYGEKKIIGNLVVEGHIDIKNKFNKIDFAKLARNILRTDTEQIITEDVIFENLNVKLINAHSLKGRDLHKFYTDVLNTNKLQFINGLTTFASDVVVLKHMNAKFINKVRFPSELLTINTFQHIKNPIRINGNVTINGPLTVDFKVNGLDWPYDIVITHGIQTITGRKYFRQPVLTVEGRITMTHRSRINDVDLSELGHPIAVLQNNLRVENLRVNYINGESVHDLLSVLKTSSRQNITAKFTFINVKVNDIYVRGLISNHLIEHDFITLGTDQVIDEEMIFDHTVKIMGNLNFRDGVLINGRDLLDIYSNAVKVNGEYVVWGHKTFVMDVKTTDVIFQPGIKLNRIDLSEQLFLTNKEQIVIGRFAIEEVEIRNNLIIREHINTKRINKVNLNDFFNEIVYVQGDFLIHGVKHFHKNVIVQHQLNVHLINNFDINQFEKKIVSLTTTQNITGYLIFRDVLYLNAQSHVTIVNHKVLTEETSGLAIVQNNRVHMAVKFQECVKFKKNVDVETLNNVNLTYFFTNLLSKSRPQNLSYTKEIIHHVTIDNLQVSKLDEVLIKNVIKIKNTNIIRAPVVFHQAIHVTSDVTFGTVNRIKLDELQKQTVIKSENVVIRGKKTFKEVETRDIIVDKFVNDININDLPKRLVQKHIIQNITANVTFKKGLTVYKLDSKVPINGVDLVHMRQTAVLKKTDQTIISRKKFISSIHHNIHIHNNVEITGSITHVNLIHGINLTTVRKDAIIDGEEQTIIAPMIFRNVVTFNEDVFVSGTTNNVRFPDDIVKVNETQEIHGSIIFHTIEIENIHITGFINHINLTHLIRNRLTFSTVQTVQRPLVFEESVIISGDLIIKKNLNDLTCKEIVTIDGDQEIFGSKIFVNVITTDIVTDFINQFHWLLLYNRIDQTVNRKWVHYEDVIFTKHVILKGPWESDIKAVKDAYLLISDTKRLSEYNIVKSIVFDRWLNTSAQCMSHMIPQIPNLVHHLDSLDRVLALKSALDIAIVHFGEELHLLLVIDPSTLPSHLQCSNVEMYTCPNALTPETCYRRTKSFAVQLPTQKTKKIDVIYGNITFLLIWNSDNHCTPQLQGLHLFGIMENSGLLFIEWFETVDSVAILPGYPFSLIALASHTAGVINIHHINCDYVYQKCHLEQKILNQISLDDGKPLKLQWFYNHDQLNLLVIIALNVTTGENRVPSFIYEWNEELRAVRKHTFFAIAPADAVAFTVNNISYMAVGSYDCLNSVDSNRLRIHHLTSEINIIQEISINTKALSIMQYLGETYLAVASQEDHVYIFRWHGFFGFQLWSKVMINKPQKINWYHYQLIYTDVLFMTIAGNDHDGNSLLVIGKTLGPKFNVQIQVN